MARLLAILCLALTASFAGCLDGGALDVEGAPADPTAANPTTGGGSHGRSSVTSSHGLGAVSGSNVQPSRFDFDVEVPSGGAGSVRWTMTIETSGNSVLNRVEGPGCAAGAMGFSVAGSNTFGGQCDDLAPGTHTFTAVLGSPATAFTAAVRGQVTVVTEW